MIHSLRKDLEPYEMAWVERVYSLMINKIKSSDFIIDIQKLVIFTNLTEMQCRRIVNYIEWEKFGWTKFEIINGSDEWKQQDKIRAAKVQKETGGDLP